MAMVQLSPPAVMPFTPAQIKEYIKVEHSDDDQVIDDLQAQAVAHLEALSGHKLITQSWRIFYDDLPDNRLLSVPTAPVISVTELRYYDNDGNSIVINANDYEIDTHNNPARVLLNIPVCPGQQFNGIEADFTAGFGSAGIDVPGNILRALMLLIAHWYEFRGSVEPGDQPVSVPDGLSRLIAPWVRPKL